MLKKDPCFYIHITQGFKAAFNVGLNPVIQMNTNLDITSK